MTNKMFEIKNIFVFCFVSLLLLGCDPNSKLAQMAAGAGYCEEAVAKLSECCKDSVLSPSYPEACRDFEDGITPAVLLFLSDGCKNNGGGFVGQGSSETALAKDVRDLSCEKLLPTLNVLWGGEDGDIDGDTDKDSDGDIDEADGDKETDTVVDGDDEVDDEVDGDDTETDTACVDDTPCNDNDPCTVDDICTNGVCEGSLKDCSDWDSDCQEGYCASNGNCDSRPLEDNLSCNDGNDCTESDVCKNGACLGTAVSDDSQTACDDDDLCTIGDICIEGICRSGNPKDCSELDDNKCVKGVCDDGVCGAENIADNTFCALGDPCVVDSRCNAGVCEITESKDCSQEDDQCNIGVCGTGGVCEKAPRPDDTVCSDNNLCTEGDRCVSGVCEALAPKDCSDGKSCTEDSCSEVGGEAVCKNELLDNFCYINQICYSDTFPNPANEYCEICDWTKDVSNWTPLSDESCTDDDPCTVGDMCQNGVCMPGDEKDCSALDGQCVLGVCGNGGVCDTESRPDDTECSDENVCTEGDLCNAGSCIPGPLKDCSAEDTECAIGTCNEANGVCYQSPREGTPTCSDDDPCTVDDYCSGILCESGEPKDCSSLDEECVTGVCRESDGACIAEDKTNNTPCSDANACTLGDRCVEGTCTPTGNKDCGDGKDCTDDNCEESNGVCSNPVKDDACLIDDTCYANLDTHPEDSACLICDSGSPLAWTLVAGYCYIAEECVTDNDPHPTEPDCQYCYADELLGDLYDWTSRADETGCSDDNECTVGDRCLSGACTSTGEKDCPESVGNPCWLPLCIPPDGTCSWNSFGREGEDCNPEDSTLVNTVCDLGICTGDALPLSIAEGETALSVTRYLDMDGVVGTMCVSLGIVTDDSALVLVTISSLSTTVTLHDHSAGIDPLDIEMELNDFAGEDKTGLWTIEITADNTEVSTTLNSFSIDFVACPSK